MFEEAFYDLIMVEGGYSNQAADRGGKTRYGITEATARRSGYKGEMRDLPLETAKDIYYRQYWDPVRCDEVAVVSKPLALELFDTAVNMGPTAAVTFMQRCLNALNRQETDFPDMATDGVMTPGTLAALKVYATKRGTEGLAVLRRAMDSLQAARYIGIAEKDPTQEVFVYGWLSKRTG